MAAVSAAREILRRLHEVMASRTGAEAKLGQVVRIVAGSMVAEVCSLYLRRGSGSYQSSRPMSQMAQSQPVSKFDLLTPSCSLARAKSSSLVAGFG